MTDSDRLYSIHWLAWAILFLLVFLIGVGPIPNANPAVRMAVLMVALLAATAAVRLMERFAGFLGEPSPVEPDQPSDKPTNAHELPYD